MQLQEKSPDTPVWIDTAEVARQAHWSKSTVESRRSRGDDMPPCYRIGKRILYKQSEVTAWIESKRKIPSSVAVAAMEATK